MPHSRSPCTRRRCVPIYLVPNIVIGVASPVCELFSKGNPHDFTLIYMPPKRILITGGNGFIGSHLAHRLKGEGHVVTVADKEPASAIPHECQVAHGNLSDINFCRGIVQDVDVIFHLAANMGGMGAIHSENDFRIYRDNIIMSLNLLHSALDASISEFIFASSACVYPDNLQDGSVLDVYLREEDAWAVVPPSPQGLYGLQKLHMEDILRLHRDKLQISVARFHNIYGPGGAWNDGREKAPAALLRKAIAIDALGYDAPPMEIWGDGSQRRSFLFIDDCIDALIRLWLAPRDHRTTPLTVNIGSSDAITIKELASLSFQVVNPNRTFAIEYDPSKPVGVASRSSNNELAYSVLGGWEPRVKISEGLNLMLPWLRGEIDAIAQHLTDEQRVNALRDLCYSRVIRMDDEKITFAILLPVTTRGSSSISSLLDNVRNFARSLFGTTFRETHEIGASVEFRLKVYIAVDHDDELLVINPRTIPDIFRSENIPDITQTAYDVPRGHVCELWRLLARDAYQDRCDYFVLMGDDVFIQDSDWMQTVHTHFQDFTTNPGTPFGIGCVAFTDTTFPGMPTFPVIHRTHMDIFGGEVVPKVFINQDGDPFLFQLYRRFGCAAMMDKRLRNTIGGNATARYEKHPAHNWSFGPLHDASSAVSHWLESQGSAAQQKLTLDVIIPSYRVWMRELENILALKSSDACSVMFIIVIDNPDSPYSTILESKYGYRPDIRIRCNDRNLGASASRNRALSESSADWVFSLDDDIEPREDLLVQAERAIRQHPNASGFVNNCLFPCADTVFTTAVHLAGVTYFWNIAEKLGEPVCADVPWGVTASLIFRRDEDDGVYFDTSFPKTGGGEDIAFCRDKREKALQRGLEGFHTAPDVVITHPWWHNGQRSYRRFFLWAYGDGCLIKMYPDLTYWDYSPNSAEIFLMSAILILVGLVLYPFGFAEVFITGRNLALSAAIVNVAHDCYRYFIRDTGRTLEINTSLTGIRWVLAVIESAFLRMANEMGRTVGVIQRKEFTSLGKRFDWFAGQFADGPRNEEKKNGLQRFCMIVVGVALLMA